MEETKIILNAKIESKELNDHLDKAIEKFVNQSVDEKLEKLIEQRIDAKLQKYFTTSHWDKWNSKKLAGNKTFDQIVTDQIEKLLMDSRELIDSRVEKCINDIISSKLLKKLGEQAHDAV